MRAPPKKCAPRPKKCAVPTNGQHHVGLHPSRRQVQPQGVQKRPGGGCARRHVCRESEWAAVQAHPRLHRQDAGVRRRRVWPRRVRPRRVWPRSVRPRRVRRRGQPWPVLWRGVRVPPAQVTSGRPADLQGQRAGGPRLACAGATSAAAPAAAPGSGRLPGRRGLGGGLALCLGNCLASRHGLKAEKKSTILQKFCPRRPAVTRGYNRRPPPQPHLFRFCSSPTPALPRPCHAFPDLPHPPGGAHD
jgi:hypothetical protein